MKRLHLPEISLLDYGEHLLDKIGGNRVPIEGALEITYRCNLRCVHCYIDSDKRRKELPTKEIFAIIDEIVDEGCLWLLITGGEPLIRDDFLDIYVYAKEKGLIITLFTNATLINEQIAKCLKKYPPFVVDISLYGATRKTYESITGVQGSFESCMRGIHILRDYQIPFSLKTMIMTLNQDEIWKMEKFAKKLGVLYRYDGNLFPKLNGSKEPCKLRISPEKEIDFEFADPRRVKSWEYFKQLFRYNNGYLHTCIAGIRSFRITPFGELQMCALSGDFFKYDLKLGSFFDGWYNIIPKIKYSKSTSNYQCKNCELFQICDQCPGRAHLENGNPEKPVDWFCQIAHLRAKKLGMSK